MTQTHKRIFSTLVASFVFATMSMAQQYPVFTQYYFNELVINPAYAGAQVQFSATTMYRNQWVNFPGAPRTINFSAHSSFMKNKVGLGLMVNHDEIGSYKNQHIFGSYSYKIHFNKATLSMGIQAGVNILGADFSKLSLQEINDESFANTVNRLKPNFGAGLYYNRKNFFLGFSVPFLINNVVATSTEDLLAQIKEARYYFLRGGTVLPLTRNKNVKLNPSFLIRTQEGQPLSFDANIAFIFYDVFSIGESFRFGDSFMTFLDLKITEQIHFSYSYDWTQSEIQRFSNGSHEFVLNFRTPIRKIHGNTECPSYYNYR